MLTDMLTVALLVVMVLPKASTILTMGWVVNGEPLVLPSALVERVALDALPKVGIMLWVVAVKPLEVKVSV